MTIRDTPVGRWLAGSPTKRVTPPLVGLVAVAALLPVVHGPDALGKVDEPRPPSYVVEDLGTLHPDPNAPPDKPRWLGASAATGISKNGTVTGWSQYAELEGNSHAFIWKNGTMRDLTFPNDAGRSVGLDVNDSGVVVGDLNLLTPFRAAGGGLVQLAPVGDANAIDNAGTVVGRAHPVAGAPGKAVWWAANSLTPVPLTPRAYRDGSATDINNRGVIVGHVQHRGEASPDHAVIWEPGLPMVDIHPRVNGQVAARGQTRALAVNDKNVVAGYFIKSHGGLTEPAIWLPTGRTWTLEGIGVLGDSGQANDINNSNVVVGTAGGKAFIYHNDYGIWALDDTLSDKQSKAWKLLTATAINDDGWIVGQGNYRGQNHAYLAKPGKGPTDTPSSTTCAQLEPAVHAAGSRGRPGAAGSTDE